MARQQSSSYNPSQDYAGGEHPNGPEPPDDGSTRDRAYGGIVVTTNTCRPPREWLALTQRDRRRADMDPHIRQQLRDLVQAALHGDNLACRKLGDLYRTVFFAHLQSQSSCDREASARDFLAFLLTGVRPNMQQEHDASVLPPLAQWLRGSNTSLDAFVWRTIKNAGTGMWRHANARERIGSTDEGVDMDLIGDTGADVGDWSDGAEYHQPVLSV